VRRRSASYLHVNVVIGGGGFAGLALGIALRQALGESFAVTVADPALAHAKSKDPRATAIAAAARRLFEAIEVWGAVKDQAQPILDRELLLELRIGRRRGIPVIRRRRLWRHETNRCCTAGMTANRTR